MQKNNFCVYKLIEIKIKIKKIKKKERKTSKDFMLVLNMFFFVFF